MNRIRRGILIAGMLLPAIALASFALLGREEAAGPVYRLSDGTKVYLKAVTSGTTHRVSRHLFGLNLPYPRELYDQQTATDALVFWVFIDTSASTNFNAFGWESINSVSDDSGCTFFQSDQRVATFGEVKRAWAPPSRIAVKAYIFDLFPKRGGTVRLRLTDPKGLEPELVFEAPNPARSGSISQSDFVVRKTDTAHGLTVTLIDARPAAIQASSKSSPASVSWAKLTMEITQFGAPSDGWEVTEVVCADTMGNSASNGRNEIIPEPSAAVGLLSASIKRCMCAAESWKVALTLKRGDISRSFNFLVKPNE